MSDGSIWLSVDPMADKYPMLSPYNYCALNPVMLVDPDGREIVLPTENDKKTQSEILKKTFGDKADRFSYENNVLNPCNTLRFNGNTDGFSKKELKVLNGLLILMNSPEITEVRFEKNTTTDDHGGEATYTLYENPNLGKNIVYVDPVEPYIMIRPNKVSQYEGKFGGVTENPQLAKTKNGIPVFAGYNMYYEKYPSSVASRYYHGLGHVLFQKANQQSKVVRFNNYANRLYREAYFTDPFDTHHNSNSF